MPRAGRSAHSTMVRRIIRVTGVVQGVGFRPFVYRAAKSRMLSGWVRNTSGSVEIDTQGEPDSVESFLAALRTDAPHLSRIDSISAIEADPTDYDDFAILESLRDDEVRGVIPVDVCTCPDCWRELGDPADRRFGYPFTNCTNCGPRFTIIRRVPYDRRNTTMAKFAMCPDCASEYRDPPNRRFHAEPTACPSCGPRVWLEMDGVPSADDALRRAGELLRRGKILAIKGLGGFHLACDARNDEAVRELRDRKGRIAKPFALMVRDMEEARRLCRVTDADRALLLSLQRPIVLMKRTGAADVSSSVAPRNKNLGLMLPYTPLHALLLEHSPPTLVMTSGNLSEEPLVFTNASARTRLARLCDAFLLHDRDIHVPCDDSVVRRGRRFTTVMRRARGYVPDVIELPLECECVLGVGAEQKNTFCLASGSSAVPSQHIGDLDSVETFDYYRYAIDHFLALFRQTPVVVAHDLHPGYMSTAYASERFGGRLVGVQHHHAHIAACLAENGRNEKCIGIAMDGTGLGVDGTIWGGEILLADLSGYERVGHLTQVRMPGGEAAIRDPKRMAAAYTCAAFGQDFESVLQRLGLDFLGHELRIIRHQLMSGLNSPLTSSAGRLFDAISTALGICRDRTYDGQPAIELEMAADEEETGFYPSEVNDGGGMTVLDTVRIFRAAVEERLAGTEPAAVSARVHNSIVRLIADASEVVRERAGLNLVALSGGVFQNVLISTRLYELLEQRGFEVLVHGLMPPNDACISVGQVAVAAATPRVWE